MDNDKSDRSLTAWICIVFLGLDIPVVTYPLPFYLWKSENRCNIERLPSNDSDSVIASFPINYNLDAWSRYDNPEEGKAIEGDIRNHPLFRKTTTTDERLLWRNGIVPYFVDDSIANKPEKLDVLRDAMDNIMKLTCVRFVRIYADGSGKFPSRNWVNITGDEQGCSSDLGRSIYGPSNINLDVERCFSVKGHALHEILHTLGVYHEHTRPDRDEYIQILWHNIKRGNAFNFQVMDETAVTNYGLPYDYDSIMHYSMTAFSKNRSIPTILPRKKNAKIGQRDRLSFYDVQKLLITYKCNAVDYKDLNAKMNRRALDRPQATTEKLRDFPPMETHHNSQSNIRDMWPNYYNYEYYYGPDYYAYYY